MTEQILDMSMHDYLRHPGISRSMIQTYRESPELYRKLYVDRTIEPREPTPQMEFGSLVDDFLTQGIVPTTYLPYGVVEAPEWVLTKDGKRAGNKYKTWLESVPNGCSVWTPKMSQQYRETQEETIRILAVIEEQILDHVKANWLVNHHDAIYQPSYVKIPLGTHLFNGKSRPDIVIPGGAVVDIKCLSSTSIKFWMHQVDALGYDIQAALAARAVYEMTGEWLDCVNVVIKNTEPYNVETYSLEHFMNDAHRLLDETIESIENAFETGAYRSKTHGKIIAVEPPRYRQYREEYVYE